MAYHGHARTILIIVIVVIIAIVALERLVPGQLQPSNVIMSDEQAKAQTAQPGGDTIFGKIIRKEAPSDILFENEMTMAIRSINPLAPTHFLVLPKKPLQGISAAEREDIQILGEMMYTAKLVAKEQGLTDGYRLVVNDGVHGCQSIYHMHIHVIGGKQLGWPPGTS